MCYYGSVIIKMDERFRKIIGIFFVFLLLFQWFLVAPVLLGLVEAASGDLDSTFGVNGKVITNSNSYYGGSIKAIALQQDGKIVAGGHLAFDNILLRYNVDGTQDTGFGDGGKVVTNMGDADMVYSVAIQTDGKIVAAGTNGYSFTLARFNPNGSLDISFGNGGKVMSDFGFGGNIVHALLIQPDGKILAAGVAHCEYYYRHSTSCCHAI